MQRRAIGIFILLVSVLTAASAACRETELISGYKHRVSDTHLTASSEYGRPGSHGPARSRLHTKDIKGWAGAWCSGPKNTNQWIQVDLGKSMLITSVATQGRSINPWYTEWVTSYQLQYSNGRGLNTYKEGQTIKTFSGNSNQDSVVRHKLRTPLYARFIRINPRTWNNWICLRWELYGCEPSGCYNNPLISGWPDKVYDWQLAASSQYTSIAASVSYSRLHTKTGFGAWRPTSNDVRQWIQVDFRCLVLVSGIATQARYDSANSKYSHKASSYYVLYSTDGNFWTTYSDGSSPRLFSPGTYSYANAVYKYPMYPFVARYVRLNPRSWYGCIAVRWEVYGCTI